MIAIIDYKAGNLTSVKLALEYIGADCKITADQKVIASAERIIFPGVGAAGEAMRNIHQLGLIDPILSAAANGTPFLGICLGTQVIYKFSEEDGGVACIGLVPGCVKKFNTSNKEYKIPQIGWNNVKIIQKHPVFEGIENNSEFYFVHSYYPKSTDTSFIIGETDYAEVRFTSVTGKNNIIATQFHPEKSGRIGLKLLDNFRRWDGKC